MLEHRLLRRTLDVDPPNLTRTVRKLYLKLAGERYLDITCTSD